MPNNIRPDTPAAGENFAVAWEPPHMGAEACTLIGYEVRYKEENAGSWERVEIELVTRFGATVEPGLYEVRVSARYGMQDVSVEAGEVQTPTPTPVPVCSISATFRPDVVLGVSGEWRRSAACVGPVRIEYKRVARHAWEHGIVDADQSFELDGLKPVKYRFRAHTLDANGRSHWSDISTFIMRRNPDTPIQVGRAENIQVSSGLNSALIVTWELPDNVAVPAGTRVSAIYVEYWSGSATTRSKRLEFYTRAQLVERNQGITNTGARTCNNWQGCPAVERMYVSLPLPVGQVYRARVITELEAEDGTRTYAYSTESDPVEIVHEPFILWFIEGTPSINSNIRLFFMDVNSNRRGASATCYVNGGDINCPPRTLVSLSVNPGGTYAWRASAKYLHPLDNGIVESIADQRAFSVTIHVDSDGNWVLGMSVLDFVWASASPGKVTLRWTKPDRFQATVGTHIGYRVSYRQHFAEVDEHGASRNMTSDWVEVDVEGADTLERTLDLYDETVVEVSSKEVTRTTFGLDYNVVAVNSHAYTHSDGTARTEVEGMKWANFYVPVPPSPTVPLAPADLRVEYGRGELKLLWKSPEVGDSAAVIKYHLRYRREGSSSGFTEVFVDPEALVDRVLTHALDPDRPALTHVHGYAHLTGLVSGERYEIAVRAINVVGGSEWVEFRSESGMGIAPD